MTDLNKTARDAVMRRRQKLIMNSLEIMLGDLVGMYGVEYTREVLNKFLEQLEMNS